MDMFGVGLQKHPNRSLRKCSFSTLDLCLVEDKSDFAECWRNRDEGQVRGNVRRLLSRAGAELCVDMATPTKAGCHWTDGLELCGKGNTTPLEQHSECKRR